MPTPAVQLTTRPPGWWSGSRGAAGAEAGGRPATKDGPAAEGVPAGEGPVSEDVRAGMKSEPLPSSITVTSLRPRLTPYHRPFQRSYANIISSSADIFEHNRSRVRERFPRRRGVGPKAAMPGRRPGARPGGPATPAAAPAQCRYGDIWPRRAGGTGARRAPDAAESEMNGRVQEVPPAWQPRGPRRRGRGRRRVQHRRAGADQGSDHPADLGLRR